MNVVLGQGSSDGGEKTVLQKTVLVVAVTVRNAYLLVSFGHRGSQCSIIQQCVYLRLQSFVFLGAKSHWNTD